jgi:hypothetical protein
VQHEIASWASRLDYLIVDLDLAEFAHGVQAVDDDGAIDPYTALDQQQAYVLAIEAGQVAQQAIEAHQGMFAGVAWGNAMAWAQRGHRQA